MDIHQFKQRIFAIDNRNYGEKFGEAIVAGMYGMQRVNGKGYDLRHHDRRCQIKSARMLADRTAENEYHLMLERAVPFAGYQAYSFGGNFQHLKLHEFDDLWYLCFFEDCILVFRMTVEELQSFKSQINYCPTQGRGSVPDSDGQFCIRHSKLSFHVQRFLQRRLTYDEALNSYLVFTKSYHSPISTDPQMNSLYDLIRSDPGHSVRYYAQRLGLPMKAVNEALCLWEGLSLVDAGFLAVEDGATPPAWAKDESGALKTTVLIVARPQKALTVLPQPTPSGSAEFDTANTESHEVDGRLINGNKRQRETALKDKIAIEKEKSQIVGRISDAVDAKEDNIEVLRIALSRSDANLASQETIINMQREEITRLKEEITVLRNESFRRRAA